MQWQDHDATDDKAKTKKSRSFRGRSRSGAALAAGLCRHAIQGAAMAEGKISGQTARASSYAEGRAGQGRTVHELRRADANNAPMGELWLERGWILNGVAREVETVCVGASAAGQVLQEISHR
ncbi:hypothetical protein ON010_g7930 [Phytophthora cinnamomi]|nr:hypothetical protein ON010_g7930 [Phytophthora cinnamomi]